MDERIKKVADILVNYSTKVKAKEKVVINADREATELALECYKLCLMKGAYPKIEMSVPGMTYIYYKYANKDQLEKFPNIVLEELKETKVVIYLGASENTKELSGIDSNKVAARRKVLRPIQEYRVNNTRWCIFDYPTNALAQDAEMSLTEFEDFVYGSTIKDWAKEKKKMEKLQKLCDKTDKVRIVGKETELTFSIKGRHAVIGDGSCNMPDGEVFTSVVEGTTNGKIYYEFPAIYGGREVEEVRLTFKNGIVVDATAKKNQEYLLKMLDMDPGARIIGEFGIGQNYGITKFVKQILFDEKIGGTIHLALGSAYKECRGKNESALHWDMIKELRVDGAVYFDGKLVMKNGKWLI